MDAPAFAAEMTRLLGLYPRPATEVQLNLLSSHDTPRFKTLARGDDSAYALATLFQMTYPGAPCIYYGDEIGMEGGHDPVCRAAFPWNAIFWAEGLRDHVKRCTALRHAHPALRRGDLTWLFSGQGVVAYGRRLGSETLLVILNAGSQPVMLSLHVAGYLPDGVRLRDVWQDSAVTVTGGRVDGVTIPARSGMVLEVIGNG
jgi:cyclomaltodextrinase